MTEDFIVNERLKVFQFQCIWCMWYHLDIKMLLFLSPLKTACPGSLSQTRFCCWIFLWWELVPAWIFLVPASSWCLGCTVSSLQQFCWGKTQPCFVLTSVIYKMPVASGYISFSKSQTSTSVSCNAVGGGYPVLDVRVNKSEKAHGFLADQGMFHFTLIYTSAEVLNLFVSQPPSPPNTL